MSDGPWPRWRSDQIQVSSSFGVHHRKDRAPGSGPGPGPRIQQHEHVERRAGNVVRSTIVRVDGLQRDLPEDAAQEFCRLHGPGLQHITEGPETRLNPLQRRSADGRVADALHAVDLRLENSQATLTLGQLGSDGRTLPATSNEVDETSNAAPNLLALRRLLPHGTGSTGGLFHDLRFDALEKVANDSRLQESLLDGPEDDVLCPKPRNPKTILASTVPTARAAVIAVALAADQHDPAAAAGAYHRAGEQVLRKDAPAGTLPGGEAATALTGRPDVLHRLAPKLDAVPEVLGDDAKRLVDAEKPLLLRLLVRAAATRAVIAVASCSRSSGPHTWCSPTCGKRCWETSPARTGTPPEHRPHSTGG